MKTMESGSPEEDTVFFPLHKDVIMALPGMVSGTSVKAKRLRPGKNSLLINIKAVRRSIAFADQISRQSTKWVKVLRMYNEN
jgi:hypothetical protein